MSDSRQPPGDPDLDRWLTRRSFLRYGGSVGAAVAGMSSGALWRAVAAAGATVRAPDSLPNRKLPAGTYTGAVFCAISCASSRAASSNCSFGCRLRSSPPSSPS